MKAYEAIANELAREGVDTLFTLLSEGLLDLTAHLEREYAEEIRLVPTRHEQGAVAMADAYARSSNRVGVCMVGRGPAVAQTGTALVTARKHGSRVLCLVPEPSLSGTHDLKEFPQESFLRDTIGEVVSIRDPDQVIPKIQYVFGRLRAGKGPVAVQVPRDLLGAEIDSGSRRSPDRGDRTDQTDSSRSRLQPDVSEIEEAVETYLDSDVSRAPVILAGRGAVRSDARQKLETLAEKINAMLVTTVGAHEWFADHPFYAGLIGSFGTTVANEYLSETDFLYVAGCSLNPDHTDSGYLLREEAKLVQVDRDVDSFDRHTPVDVDIHGDVRETTREFINLLDERGIDRSGAFWTDSARRAIENHDPLDQGSFSETPGTIDPRTLVRWLDGTLPEDRIVVHEAGQSTLWVVDGIRAFHPRYRIWNQDFAALGLGLPMAIGGAVASDRTSVAFCGDAGFFMSVQELDTAVREQIPVVVIVLNDEALGAEYNFAGDQGGLEKTALLPTPEFADIAEDFGAEGYTVRSEDDFEQLTDVLSATPTGPLVVDCRINRSVVHRYMR